MSILLNIVLWLVLLGLIWWLIDTYLPLPDPIKTIIRVIFIVILILIVLSMVGVVNLPLPRMHLNF